MIVCSLRSKRAEGDCSSAVSAFLLPPICSCQIDNCQFDLSKESITTFLKMIFGSTV